MNPEEMNTETPNVVELHKLPQANTVSTTILVITITVLVFAAIAGVAYYSFNSTLQAKVQERRENELLYSDASDQNILGAETSKLPQVQLGKTNRTPGAGTQQQAQSQQMVQMPNGQQQKVPPYPTDKPATSPTPTKVPDNVFVSKDDLFSMEHDKWSRGGKRTEGDTYLETLTSIDGKYKLHIGITNKKYDSIQAYLDTNPRGRKPTNGTSDITLGGETGKKTTSFIGDFEGSTYKTIGGYVFSKDKQAIYSIELDTTELDVNNNSNEDIFNKIKDSFKFIEKKD